MFAILRMFRCEYSVHLLLLEPPLMCRRLPDGYYVTTPIPHWAFMNVTVSAY